MPKKIFFVIAVMACAIWLRVILLDKPGYVFDIQSFVSWGEQVKSGGLKELYADSNNYAYKYPPIVPAMTALATDLNKANPQKAFKYIPITFDILLSLITIYFVLLSKLDKKYYLAAIVAIQPAFALAGAGWGQVDSVLATFIVLGAVTAIKYEFLATAIFFLAILVKPQAILALAVYLAYLFFAKKIKVFITQIGFLAVIYTLTEIIFRKFFSFSIWPFLANSVGFYKNLSLNAFNFWWLTYGHRSWDIQDTAKAIISFKSIGLALFALSIIPAILYLRKAKKAEDLALVMGYVYLAFFVFPTQIHERYLFPAVALLAFAPLVDKKFFYPYIALVATFLVNIFAVLQSVYPQFIFLRYNLLAGDWTRIIAAINVGICLYLFAWFCQKVIINEKI